MKRLCLEQPLHVGEQCGGASDQHLLGRLVHPRVVEQVKVLKICGRIKRREKGVDCTHGVGGGAEARTSIKVHIPTSTGTVCNKFLSSRRDLRFVSWPMDGGTDSRRLLPAHNILHVPAKGGTKIRYQASHK